MGLTEKAIRKLKLGGAVSSLLSPFASDSAPLPTEAEAEACLQALSPDAGSSCLIPPRPHGPGTYDADVIIPVYNAGAFLRPCLDSVLGQETAYRFRVIAVDDGSADGSGAVLDAVRDERLVVLHRENAGAAAARNRGLDLADGRYIAFLDADDLMSPGFLQTMIARADETGAVLLEGGYCTVDPEGRKLRDFPHADGPMDARGCTGFPPGKLYRAELFDALRFPEGYLFEDSLLAQVLLPLAGQRGAVYGVAAEAFRYRMHPRSTGRTNRGRVRSVDSFRVTRALYRDRQALGLPTDQRYYEYLLNMVLLTFHRTEQLEEPVRRALFVLWRAFFEQELSGFSTQNPARLMLEQALRAGDYGRYSLYCAVN